MTDAELWAAWRFWMIVAGVVVLVAAALLVTIWLTALSIRAHAARARRALEAIRDNTAAIWELQTTSETAEQLLETVRTIEAKVAGLVAALESHAAAGGRR